MPDIYNAGGTVTKSGVYKAVHSQQHTPSHYVTVSTEIPSRRDWNVRTGSGLSSPCPSFTSAHIPNSIAARKTVNHAKRAGI